MDNHQEPKTVFIKGEKKMENNTSQQNQGIRAGFKPTGTIYTFSTSDIATYMTRYMAEKGFNGTECVEVDGRIFLVFQKNAISAGRKMSHNTDEMMENLLGGGGRSYKFVLNDKLRQVLEPLAADRRGGQGYKGHVHVDTYKENRNIATVELSPDRLIAFMCSVPNENRDRVSITLIDAKRMDRRHTVYRVARNEGQRKEAAPSIADLIGKRH